MSTLSFSQKLDHAIGLNLNFLHNKYYGGIDYKLLQNVNNKTTTLLWSFQLDYGILGIQEYATPDENIDTTGRGITIIGGKNPPIYDGNRPWGYYTNYQKVKMKGFQFSVIKDFKWHKFFYFGIGVSYANAKDMGYITYRNPRTNHIITDSYENIIESVSIITKPSIYIDLNQKLSLNIAAHFYYYWPISNDQTHAKLPIVGVEQDLSVSVVYKL